MNELDTAIGLLITAYPTQDFPVAAQQTFRLMLEDLDNPLDAVKHLVATAGQWRPDVSAIRAASFELINPGVPGGMEAWAEVQRAFNYGGVIRRVRCDEGVRLADEATGDEYWEKLFVYSHHVDECEDCTDAHASYEYSHPMIERAVKDFGGLDAIFTDNDVSNRSQFIKGYEQVITRVQKEQTTLPELQAPGFKDLVKKLSA